MAVEDAQPRPVLGEIQVGSPPGAAGGVPDQSKNSSLMTTLLPQRPKPTPVTRSTRALVPPIRSRCLHGTLQQSAGFCSTCLLEMRVSSRYRPVTLCRYVVLGCHRRSPGRVLRLTAYWLALLVGGTAQRTGVGNCSRLSQRDRSRASRSFECDCRCPTISHFVQECFAIRVGASLQANESLPIKLFRRVLAPNKLQPTNLLTDGTLDHRTGVLPASTVSKQTNKRAMAHCLRNNNYRHHHLLRVL